MFRRSFFALVLFKVVLLLSFPAVAESQTNWWSLQPLQKRELPKVSNPGWVRTPIDQFILAKLDEKGLKPAPEADKRTLLRRVYFDLIGLPPTPEEVQAFLTDESVDAYTKVVDRLLASPRYGERWARHWLDVVHYADSHGHDHDRARLNAWRYRDYVIRSFNEDKPYALFVEEQLAGDVLYPSDAQAVIATGFVAAGPWDQSTLGLNEDTVDKKIARNLDRDDMVMTVMSTFVSATVHCARCHDHKFDPISQKEYYSLQAVFAGVERGDRLYDAEEKSYQLRQARLQHKEAIEKRGQASPGSLLDPSLRAEMLAWEKELAHQKSIWTVLDPETFTATNGTKLIKQADQSLLASGQRPDVDTYTIIANTDLKGITAVRLELLTDESLPHKGPGRDDEGNLQISEFRVIAASRTNAADVRAVTLQNPTSRHNQKTLWNLIDDKDQTSWGTFPIVGKPQEIYFESAEPIGFDGGTTLRFGLSQKSNGGHLIGRFRFSATTNALPVRYQVVAERIVGVLAIPADRRTESEQADLAIFYINHQLGLPPQSSTYGVVNSEVRPIYRLKRGDVNNPQEQTGSGTLSCIPGLTAEFHLTNSTDCRVALARWITSPQNVLTWRSIVNRLWHYHFGRGLVDSPNDFGRMGALPTHPELLDWLAISFLESGGSIKQLQKLIVTSSAYRQSSQHDTQSASVDDGNRYLWRMNRSRLDAESVRDAILQITGKLDLTMGGPAVKQFIERPGLQVTPMLDYAHFDADNPANYRRSIYRFIYRTLPDPFMDSLDCADASQLTPVRNNSVTVFQALAMMHDQFILKQSDRFAARLIMMRDDLPAQITAAYNLALGRSPSAEEASALEIYAAQYGLSNACRILLNSNEFIFVN
ncbi:MAG: Protein of unknown function (DUF1553)/Protein of unknown function (DUF1549)/Planctomycete [Pedosphaera sp.]|nr:Protein of unknown function (DUF1553)/Protein of unknown function (DUF1549)/Planctomycete [Pedosphaera sp.]